MSLDLSVGGRMVPKALAVPKANAYQARDPVAPRARLSAASRWALLIGLLLLGLYLIVKDLVA